MPISVDHYVSSVRKFNEAVSLLATTLEQVIATRSEAIRASQEVRKELDATDQRIEELVALVRQQVSPELLKKIPRSEDMGGIPEVRRAG